MSKEDRNAKFLARQRAAQQANDADRAARGVLPPPPKPRMRQRDAAIDAFANTYMRDPDGYDRDNLGESPDY